jgi:hypothetical protein
MNVVCNFSMKSTLFIFFLLLGGNALAQQWHTDVPPTGKVNYLPVEGGSIKIKIDSVTPLNKLIDKLNDSWELIETGKAYWIGYTDNMFSIAAKQSKAITPLLDLIDTCQSYHTKLGALYTLHLIGIDSRIEGRFIETFSNMEARRALLLQLKKPELRRVTVSLLIRDPKLSDIPEIIKILKADTTDCWELNNFITQFAIDLPIHQNIPESFFKFLELDYTEDLENNLELKIDSLMQIVFQLNSGKIEIDSNILYKSYWKPLLSNSATHYMNENKLWINLTHFLYKSTNVDYIDIGSELQYYFDGIKIHICTQKTAKERLIKWWNDLDSKSQENFYKDISPEKLSPSRPFGE